MLKVAMVIALMVGSTFCQVAFAGGAGAPGEPREVHDCSDHGEHEYAPQFCASVFDGTSEHCYDRYGGFDATSTDIEMYLRCPDGSVRTATAPNIDGTSCSIVLSLGDARYAVCRRGGSVVTQISCI